MSRPKISDLKKILECLVAHNAAERVVALVRALRWYDQLYDKDGDSLPPSCVKHYALGADEREAGISTSTDIFKERLFKKALGYFELAFGMPRAVRVERFYRQLDAASEKLKRDAVKAGGRFSKVLDVLAVALQPVNCRNQEIRFGVMGRAKSRRDVSERMFNAEMRLILYSRVYAQRMKDDLRNNGILPVVLGELPFVAAACATEANRADGSYVSGDTAKLEAMERLLYNVSSWSGRSAATKLLLKKLKKRKTDEE